MENLKARALQGYLEEQFPNSPGFFLYKDKKLLEQGRKKPTGSSGVLQGQALWRPTWP